MVSFSAFREEVTVARLARPILTLICMLAAAQQAPAVVDGERWHARLLDDGTDRTAQQPLRLAITGRPTAGLPTDPLRFWLDGRDVTTAVAVAEDGVASYTPAAPLSPGTHELRLTGADAGNDGREIGRWTVTIADPAEGPQPDSPPRSSALLAAFAELEIPDVGPDPETERERGEETLQDSLLATLQAESAPVPVERQTLSYNSLIHKQVDRGAAVAGWDLGARTQVRGFGVQSQADKGFKRLVGRDKADYQFNGVVIEQSMPLKGGDEFQLTSGWVAGSARTHESRAHGGSAWSIAADTTLLSRQLHLRTEYAGSQFEWATADGDRTLRRDEAGSALSAGIEYRAPSTASTAWHIGSEYSEVAPWFGSLANPTLAADRVTLRTYGGLSVEAWAFDVALDRRRNNLDADPSRPVVTNDKLQLTTTWTPDDAGIAQLLGNPSYKLTTEFGNRRELVISGDAAGNVSDQHSVNLALQSDFRHEVWRWGVRAKGGLSPTAVDATLGQGSRVIGLDLFGDFTRSTAVLPIKPSLSWQQRRDVVTGTRAARWRAAVASSAFEIDEGLHANFDLSYQLRRRSDGVDEADSTNLGANLVWTLQRPSAQRRGLALALSGSLLNGPQATTTADTKPGYSLMVSITTENPLGSW